MSQRQQNNILLARFDSPLAAMPAPAKKSGYDKNNSRSSSSVQQTALNLWRALIAPETFTGDIFLNDVQTHPRRSFQGFSKISRIFFGASTCEFFHQRCAPSILAREYGLGCGESNSPCYRPYRPLRSFHKANSW